MATSGSSIRGRAPTTNSCPPGCPRVSLGTESVSTTPARRALKQEVTAGNFGCSTVAIVVACICLSLLGGIVGIVMSVIGVAIGLLVMASMRAEHKLLKRMGHPVLEIPDVLIAGQAAAITLRIQPVKRLTQVTARLELTGEEGYRTSGNRSKVHKSALPKVELALADVAQILDGEPWQATVDSAIPRQMPASFDADRAWVKWSGRLEICADGRVARRSVPIRILPPDVG